MVIENGRETRNAVNSNKLVQSKKGKTVNLNQPI